MVCATLASQTIGAPSAGGAPRGCRAARRAAIADQRRDADQDDVLAEQSRRTRRRATARTRAASQPGTLERRARFEQRLEQRPDARIARSARSRAARRAPPARRRRARRSAIASANASPMSWVTSTIGLADLAAGCAGTRGASRRGSPGRARRTARPSAGSADRRPAPGPRRRAAADRRRARAGDRGELVGAAGRPASSISCTRAALTRSSVPSGKPRHHRDVLGDRHVRKQPDLLQHVADAAPQRERIPLGRRFGRRRRPDRRRAAACG